MAGGEGIARKDELSVPRRHAARTSREGLSQRLCWVHHQKGWRLKGQLPACVFFDQTSWSVLVLESLSCERRAFDEERAPVERSAALCVPASALNVDSSSDHS